MPRIACFGALHVDVSAVADGEVRLGTSNPVRTSQGTGGVAANVARVLARLGERVVMCSAVGADVEGEGLVGAIEAEGIDSSGVARVAGAGTARYTAVIDGDGGLVVGLADTAIYEGLGNEWAEAATDAAAGCGVWMLDTNLPATVIGSVVGAADGRFVVADPVSVAKARRLDEAMESLSAVFPDGAELEALTGSADRLRAAAALHALGPTVVASYGAEGVVVADDSTVRALPAAAVERVVDETGAGDALLGGFLHGLLGGDDDPVSWGLAAAALAVSEKGSVPAGLTREAVKSRVQRRGPMSLEP